MFRPRVIPVLLLKNLGLIKSINFKNHRYIGDPHNAVKLFNDLKADELVFLDILATIEKRCISIDFVKKVGAEANMPFSVGGGISKIEEIRQILKAGAEKVIINSAAVNNPKFIFNASEEFGASTIAVSIDVKKTLLSGERVYINSGKKKTRYTPLDLVKIMEENGAGEIILNSIDTDGMMQGYDIELVKKISEAVSIPLVAVGGAGSTIDLKSAVREGGASAVGAGSLFIYQGPRKAVLINYPSRKELKKIFS